MGTVGVMALRKNKASYSILISLGLWTILCLLETWIFIYKHHFSLVEEAIFSAYGYTFSWALLVWMIPAIALVMLYLIFPK